MSGDNLYVVVRETWKEYKCKRCRADGLREWRRRRKGIASS